MNNPFHSVFEEFIYKSRYARWLDKEGRRENWDETVHRLVEAYAKQYHSHRPLMKLSDFPYDELYSTVYNHEVLPSMRALMTAGPALDRCNVSAYNCAYLPVDSPRSFDEAMYILLNGTGVGYSVESKYVDQLPRISEQFERTDSVIVVADSKEGWSKSFRELFSLLIAGQIPLWDTSGVRPAGARLKTFGGRASGPEPLEDLFRFTVALLTNAAGRRLTSLECHDLMCKIGDIVVVGGVRRSAMISLFDGTDDRMSMAKSGAWWEKSGYRRLANNSAVYEHRRPDTGFFMKKWKELYDSKSGEPGFFSRYACQRIAKRYGKRDPEYAFGTNPCSEIILRPYQFCNLTSVIVRAGDTVETLKRKVRVAAILGTIQATFTNFKYLRKIWQKNCEDERLLGVSLNGVCDNLDLILTPGLLSELRVLAEEVNLEWSNLLGTKPAAATTCVKPEGTTSKMVNCAPGLHARHSRFYLQTVRADNKDPLTQFLKDSGVYNEADVTAPSSTTVFYFPIEGPEGALVKDDVSAVKQLELWKTLQEEYCEHKPSITVSVKEDEWMETGSWVFKNFDLLSGVAFLPHDGGSYKQAPYQELTEEAYREWVGNNPTPVIDWDDLRHYEQEDNTTGSQELACSGGACEIVEIGRPDYDG